ncbi:MAG: hypothetical protein V4693_17930 [Pseudomonadota bacterium]
MNRQSIIRVLLSLLLLLTQQMAIAHAMTHWAGAPGGAAQLHQASAQLDDGGVASAFAQDKACEKCLAFAHLAGAVGSPARCFFADAAASCAAGPGPAEPDCARPRCAAQPRGPPSIV